MLRGGVAGEWVAVRVGVLWTVLLGALGSCAQPPGAVTFGFWASGDGEALSADEHGVIAALVPTHFALERPMLGYVPEACVALDGTKTEWGGWPAPGDSEPVWVRKVLARWPQADASMVVDFLRAARVPGRVAADRLPADAPLYVWAEQDLGPPYTEDWRPSEDFRRRFEESFPGAVSFLCVSRPGVSADGAQAMILLGSARVGPSQCEWYYVFLTRSGSQASSTDWVVQAVASSHDFWSR